VQIVAQAHEHLVSQCMQEESKLVGQESMTAESVHAQMILEGLVRVARQGAMKFLVGTPQQFVFNVVYHYVGKDDRVSLLPAVALISNFQAFTHNDAGRILPGRMPRKIYWLKERSNENEIQS